MGGREERALAAGNAEHDFLARGSRSVPRAKAAAQHHSTLTSTVVDTLQGLDSNSAA